MNSFDAVVYAVLAIAVVMGFRSGLLRSLATIIGYLAAAPVALATQPLVATLMAGQTNMPQTKGWALLAGIFVVTGIVLGMLMRAAVTAMFGPTASIPDRIAGSFLGAVRIGLLAVLMVLIFDRILPPHIQPDFLVGSRLRPHLSAAGQAGLKSLPPDVEIFIDQLKRDRGL